MVFTEKSYKSILNVRKSINNWFWDKYSINPYNGCQFGCIYCDSRSSKYHLPLDFQNDILVKSNAAQLLDQRITMSRTLMPDVVAVGGTTDPYQPAESIYQITRSCLEVLYRHGYPVHICTKSRLVLWDLDLLERIAQKSWCTVSVTLTTTNQVLARFLEPRAPSPEQRLDIIRTIKERSPHVQTGVLLMPVVPFLNDQASDLNDLLSKVQQAGADYILFAAGMTLRDAQAVWFLKHIQEQYPQMIPYYESLYKFTYSPNHYEGAYQPNTKYLNNINQLLATLCEKHKLPTSIKRFIPGDYRRDNYRIAEMLFSMALTAQYQGKPWKKIIGAALYIQSLKGSVGDLVIQNGWGELEKLDSSLLSFIRQQLTSPESNYRPTCQPTLFD